MIVLFALVVSALGTALNVVMYVLTGSPWSLGAAIFCGFLSLFNLASAARR